MRWWRGDHTNGGRRRLVGTAYIIDLDGTVYEVFDPTGWAYQFGLDWTPTRRLGFERRFIGIEIASEGGLIEHGWSTSKSGSTDPRGVDAARGQQAS